MAWSLPWARKAVTPAGPDLDADDAWSQHVSTLAAHGIPEPGSTVGGQPRRPATEFYVGGDAHNGFVVDYSETGAGISAKVRPPLGTAIEIGDLPAVVVRHMDVGFAVQFGAGLALDSIESHLGQRRGAPAA